MFKTFYPYEYINSTYDIDFLKLYNDGFRGVIFDIDNTLVPHGAPADARAEELFKELHLIGFDTCLLSNNDEDRVKLFLKNIESKYIYNAHKPITKNYIKAMKKMKTSPRTTLFVGDQLFTDLWGANKAGIRSILVKPIHPKEEIQIVLKRKLERIVLFFYKRRKELHHRLGEINKHNTK